MAATASKSGQTLPVLDLVQSSRWVRILAKFLLYGLILTILALAFLPWQQTSRATGKVTALDPQNRPQTITSLAEGVVEFIPEKMLEGVKVIEGETIMVIEPLSANLKAQLDSQLASMSEKKRTASAKVESYRLQRESYVMARTYAVDAAIENLNSAKNKLASKEEALEMYRSKKKQTRLNYDRQKELFEDGLRAEKDFEKVRMDYEMAVAGLETVLKEVESAKDDVAAKAKEVEAKRADAQAKVDYAEAMREAAMGEVATAEKDYTEVDMKKDGLRLEITAPRSGSLLRLNVFEKGQQIKKGDSLFTIVPDSQEHAVELFVAGNDLQWIQVGNEVRLQFESWPAVQWVGWPSISVGSFGGVVSAIDATDDGMGRFRVLVRPIDENEWPEQRFLLQGVRANGWVMLGEVPLWFELWRQLNGFPPAVSKDDPKEDKPTKVPKLAK